MKTLGVLIVLTACAADAGLAFLLGRIGTPWWVGLCIVVGLIVAWVATATVMGRDRAERVQAGTKVAP